MRSRLSTSPGPCLSPLASRLGTCAGLSLTEAMVTLIAGLAVIGAAFQGLTHFQQRLATQHQVIGRTQDMRLGLQVLETELRLAGTGMSDSAPALLKAD